MAVPAKSVAMIFSPEFFNDPYPTLAFLRDTNPVLFIEPLNLWLITRYDDAVAASKDHRRLSSEYRFNPGALPPESVAGLRRLQENTMLFLDPPDHTRLRGLVHKVFTPRTIQNLYKSIETIVEELLNDLEGQRDIDLIRDFSYPLPIRVILDMIGIPLEDHALFRKWSRDIIVGTDLGAADDAKLVGNDSMCAFNDYLCRAIEQRRQNPTDDLLSMLVHAEEEGDKLTVDEMIGTVILLIIAGHETTTSLIANGTLALAHHPEQFAMLKRDPGLIPQAVEEMLRYDGPVMTNPRIVLEDMDIRGQKLYAGQQVGIILLGANRDPHTFPNPDAFDITRNPNPHMAFGHGIHFCLGAPLARLEAQIAFKALLARWNTIEVTSDTLEYVPTPRLHALKALPLRVG